jgi:DNA-binding NarL/FixJ family response regulator
VGRQVARKGYFDMGQMTYQRPITLLVVDDHQLVREGLKELLENYPEFAIVAEAGNSKDALREAILHKPDVVLMDVRLPGNDGIKTCQRILAELPQTRVIILTGFEDEATLLAAVRAGAVGYMIKTVESGPLISAIKQVAAGGVSVDPRLGVALFENVRRQAGPSTGVVALSDFIHAAFSPAELKDLCLRLAVNYDDLPEDTHQLKAIELVLYCERHNQVADLEKMVKKLRPHYGNSGPSKSRARKKHKEI